MVKTRTGLSTTTEMELTDEFKAYVDSSFEQLLDNLATKDAIEDLKQEVTLLINEIEEQEDQIIRLESTTSVQEERITVLEAQNAVLESHVNRLLSAQEEQEQYSTRLSLRIDRMEVPKKGQNETSEHCLEKVKKIIEEIGVDVPDAVIDRAHRIGPTKEKDGKATQQIIVRFTTIYLFRILSILSIYLFRISLFFYIRLCKFCIIGFYVMVLYCNFSFSFGNCIL